MGNALPGKWMTIVAAVALITGLVIQFPAAVAMHWFLPAAVETRGISGTLWRGRVDALRIENNVLGPVSWRLHPTAFLRGRVGASVEAGLPGGFFDGDISAGGDSITISDARAAVELAPVTRLSSIGPSEGSVRVTVRKADFDALWPTRLDADVVLSDLRYPPVGPRPLGSFNLNFDPALATDASLPVAAELSSIDGPFDVDGMLRLGDNRSYSMRARVAAKPDADQQVRNALRVLGPAQPDGSHQLAFDGNL